MNVLNKLKEYKNRRIIYILLLFGLSLYLYIGNIVSRSETGILIECIIFGTIYVGGFIALLILDYIRGINKFDRVGIIMMFVLFVTMLIVVVTTPNSYELTVVGYSGSDISAHIEISNVYKLKILLSYFAMLSLVYSSFFIYMPLIKIRSKLFIYTAIAWIVFVLVLCLLTFVFEGENYVLFIQNITTSPQNYAIESIMSHRNTWGLILLITMYIVIMLGIVLKKKWIAISSLVFYAFMIFSLCKTTLVIGIVIFLGCSIYYLICSYKDNKKRNIIIASCMGALIVVGLIVALATPLRETLIIVSSKGNDSFEARTVIWYKISQMTNSPEKVIFGVGRGILDRNLYEINLADVWYSQNWNTFKAHNMYVQTYGDGGILLSLAFLFVVGYIARLLIKNYKKDPVIYFTLILGFVSLLGYWFFES